MRDSKILKARNNAMACKLVPMTHKADKSFRISSQEAVLVLAQRPVRISIAGRQRRREPLSAQGQTGTIAQSNQARFATRSVFQCSQSHAGSEILLQRRLRAGTKATWHPCLRLTMGGLLASPPAGPHLPAAWDGRLVPRIAVGFPREHPPVLPHGTHVSGIVSREQISSREWSEPADELMQRQH